MFLEDVDLGLGGFYLYNDVNDRGELTTSMKMKNVKSDYSGDNNIGGFIDVDMEGCELGGIGRIILQWVMDLIARDCIFNSTHTQVFDVQGTLYTRFMLDNCDIGNKVLYKFSSSEWSNLPNGSQVSEERSGVAVTNLVTSSPSSPETFRDFWSVRATKDTVHAKGETGHCMGFSRLMRRDSRYSGTTQPTTGFAVQVLRFKVSASESKTLSFWLNKDADFIGQCFAGVRYKGKMIVPYANVLPVSVGAYEEKEVAVDGGDIPSDGVLELLIRVGMGSGNGNLYIDDVGA
jgi:hypothetical protein